MIPAFSGSLSGVQATLVRGAWHLLNRPGARASLLVLIFHRVLPASDPLLPDEPDAADFAALIDALQSHFELLGLRDAVRRLRADDLPPRAVCITFDDGYANNADVALPILHSRGAPATVFIAPGYLNGGRMFNDTVIETIRRAPAELDLTAEGLGVLHMHSNQSRREALNSLVMAMKYRRPDERAPLAERIAERIGVRLPTDLMMTDAQVRQLARSGIEIGAHTVNHPILTQVDDDVAQSEILRSRHLLEEMIDAPVVSFAYPNGGPGRDYAASHVRMARNAGFELAVSTAWGAASRSSDPMQIPRVAPWDRSATRYLLRLMRAYGQQRFAAV